MSALRKAEEAFPFCSWSLYMQQRFLATIAQRSIYFLRTNQDFRFQRLTNRWSKPKPSFPLRFFPPARPPSWRLSYRRVQNESRREQAGADPCHGRLKRFRYYGNECSHARCGKADCRSHTGRAIYGGTTDFIRGTGVITYREGVDSFTWLARSVGLRTFVPGRPVSILDCRYSARCGQNCLETSKVLQPWQDGMHCNSASWTQFVSFFFLNIIVTCF